MNPLRILLVDDNPIFLEAAAHFLSRQPLMEIVGRAKTGLEAIRLVEQLSPALVVMDMAMPHMNGLEATRRIKSKSAPPRVIIVTLDSDAKCRADAQEVGADGFINKLECTESMLPLITKLFAS